jgi:hypothetical protein
MVTTFTFAFAVSRRALLAASVLPLLIGGPALLAPAPVRAQMSAAQKLGVSFTPPAGYRAMNPSEVPPAARAAMSGASVFFVGPITNKFATNVNLVVQPSGGQKVLPADLPAQMEAGMRSQMPSYKILGSGRLTVAGTPAVRVDGSLIQPPANTAVRNRQVFVLRGERVYVFTFSSASAAFARDVPAFDRMMQTVRWTK